MRFALPPDAIAESLAGALATERVGDGVRALRLPPDARALAPRMLEAVSSFGAGVHLRLRTPATVVRLEVTVTRLVMGHLTEPASPASFEARVDGVITDRVDLTDTDTVVERPEQRPRNRGRQRVELSLGRGGADVAVWFPPDAAVVVHAVLADAPLESAGPAAGPLWLHHGSSISHCGDADGPLGTWPAQAAHRLGVRSTNLGFGGNAMLDPFVARAIAGAEADVITLKIGVNLVTGDAMRLRTFVPALHGFLDLVHDGHPETPIVMITAISCPALEETPGPVRSLPDGTIAGTPRATRPGDGTLTLAATRSAVEEVVAVRQERDARLFVDDGRALLGPDEAHLLGDGIHPNQRGYDLMGERFAARAADPATGLGAGFAAAGVNGR